MIQEQVTDNPALLKLMMEDIAVAPGIYQPTNYWSVYEKHFLPELLELGLKDFRRRKGSVLSSFSATDLSPCWAIDLSRKRILNNKIIKRIPYWSKFLSFNSFVLDKILCTCPSYMEYIKRTPYEYTKWQGEKVAAKSIDELTSSVVGNPENIIRVGHRSFTKYLLDCYLRYAYASQYIDFSKVNTFVELGSGSGTQIEVMRKLFPKMSFFVFDIPPQLYVCEQYLSSVFPDSVIGYEKTRRMDSIPERQEGKIYIFGTWKFPILEQLEIDLFWNAASFQEMEPRAVSNYLKYVNTQAKAVYLCEKMHGSSIAKAKGQPGVLDRVTLQEYRNALTNFQLIDISPPKVAERRLAVPRFSEGKKKAGKSKKKAAVLPLFLKRVVSPIPELNSFWCRK